MGALFDSYMAQHERENAPLILASGTSVVRLGKLIDGCRLVRCDELRTLLDGSSGRPRRWRTEDGRVWFVGTVQTMVPEPGTEMWIACVHAKAQSVPAMVELHELKKPTIKTI